MCEYSGSDHGRYDDRPGHDGARSVDHHNGHDHNRADDDRKA